MSFTAITEHLRIDSDSVVTNPYLQLSIRIFQLEFDTLCPGMAKRIEQSLSSNPVNLLQDEGVHRLLPSCNIDAKINIRSTGKLLLNARQRNHQIRGCRIRRAQSSNRASTLFDPSTHDLKNPIQPRFHRRFFGYSLNRHPKLHRGAQEGLKERVVKFLGNASALFQTDVFQCGGA